MKVKPTIWSKFMIHSAQILFEKFSIEMYVILKTVAYYSIFLALMHFIKWRSIDVDAASHPAGSNINLMPIMIWVPNVHHTKILIHTYLQ